MVPATWLLGVPTAIHYLRRMHAGDLMQAVEGARGYEQLREAAIVKDGISYVGLDDLIAMKHAAGRDLDHIDIRALEEPRGATS